MIRLITERLVIRDPLLIDFTDWHRLISDPESMYYLPDILTQSPDESRENLESAVDESANPNRTKYFFVIEHSETGVFIGTVGYTVTQMTPLGKLVSAGYFILPEYHGQGYTTEAFSEIIRFAFENDDVYRISTGCITENKASERIMQKCGMIKEAEFKQRTWHDGRMKDRVEYRLLKKEWLSKKNYLESDFWQALDLLISDSEIIIDRPKNSVHPHYQSFKYPLDYGYLNHTTAMDGGGIDVWCGSDSRMELDAIMCIVDLLKRDSEIKLLIGCTEEETEQIYRVHNETEYMKGVLIHRTG